MADLQASIEQLWENRSDLDVDDTDANRLITEAVTSLDRGEVRVAEIAADGTVVVHEWLKLAILLYFRQSDRHHRARSVRVRGQDPPQARLPGAGVRVVPGASARFGSFLDGAS